MEKPLELSRKKQTAKQRKQNTRTHTHTHKIEILFLAKALPPLEQDELVKTEDRREDKQNAENAVIVYLCCTACLNN